MHMYCSHLKIFCRLSHISAVLQAGAVTLGVGSSGSGNGPQLSLSGGYASTGAGGSVLLRTGGSATAATGDLDMFTASSTSGKYLTVTSTLRFFSSFYKLPIYSWKRICPRGFRLRCIVHRTSCYFKRCSLGRHRGGRWVCCFF